MLGIISISNSANALQSAILPAMEEGSQSQPLTHTLKAISLGFEMCNVIGCFDGRFLRLWNAACDWLLERYVCSRLKSLEKLIFIIFIACPPDRDSDDWAEVTMTMKLRNKMPLLCHFRSCLWPWLRAFVCSIHPTLQGFYTKESCHSIVIIACPAARDLVA